MQHQVTKAPLTPVHKAQVLAWLAHPSALLFKRMLASAIVSSQLVAGSKLTEYPDDEDAQNKAVGAARIGNQFLAAHEVLTSAAQEVADGASPAVPFETLTLTT